MAGAGGGPTQPARPPVDPHAMIPPPAANPPVPPEPPAIRDTGSAITNRPVGSNWFGGGSGANPTPAVPAAPAAAAAAPAAAAATTPPGTAAATPPARARPRAAAGPSEADRLNDREFARIKSERANEGAAGGGGGAAMKKKLDALSMDMAGQAAAGGKPPSQGFAKGGAVKKRFATGGYNQNASESDNVADMMRRRREARTADSGDQTKPDEHVVVVTAPRIRPRARRPAGPSEADRLNDISLSTSRGTRTGPLAPGAEENIGRRTNSGYAKGGAVAPQKYGVQAARWDFKSKPKPR